MQLRRASEYYAGPSLHFNALWRHIFDPISKYMVDIADELFDELYTDERIHDDGVEVADVANHVAKPSGKPLLIRGDPGVGKTTFLRHALREGSFDRGELLWVNVLKDVLDGPNVPERVLAVLSSKIQHRISEISNGDLAGWHAFALERAVDPYGRSQPLLQALRAEPTAQDSELSREIRGFLKDLEERYSLLDFVRLGLGYLREQTGKPPVAVIDNIDQHSTSAIRGILLAAGSFADAPEGQRSVVIVGARPTSVRESMAQLYTTFPSGTVSPPNLREVFGRRLRTFLKDWDGRLLDVRSREGSKIHRILTSDGDVDLRTASKDLVGELAEGLLEDVNLLTRISVLANYNTRICLLAIGNYCASGHLDLRRLVASAHARRTGSRASTRISWRKSFMVLILGIQSIYRTRNSWVMNLLGDGTNDERSTLIRPRILHSLETGQGYYGLSIERLIEIFGTLFDYDGDSIHRTLEVLAGVGAIRQEQDDEYRITECGKQYLLQLEEFEYLQHIAVDVAVPSEYLVQVREADESALRRAERVIRMATWLRDIEEEEEAAREEAHGRLYDQYLGGWSASARVLDGIDRAWSHLPQHGHAAEWDRIADVLNALRRRVKKAGASKRRRKARA